MPPLEKEKYYIALNETNGYRWTVFQSRPDQATAEQTGFVAVGEGFEKSDDAWEKVKILNSVMFGR